MRRNELNRRRDQIIGMLCEHPALSASELAERLDVSVQTIRADLRDLDESSLVQRRNGLVRLRQQSENIGYTPRISMARLEKRRIALAVKGLVADGARIALGTGTTVEACAQLLAAHQGLFVATNNLHAVIALHLAPRAEVMVAGGAVRLRDLDLIGTASTSFFSDYRVEQAIFSCGGVSEAGEVLDYNTDEIAARVAISGCAAQKILVVDSTKFGRDLPCRKHMIWDYDIVVTGADLSPGLVAKCTGSGCRVVHVNNDEHA